MKKSLQLICLLVLSFNSNNAQNFEWVQNTGAVQFGNSKGLTRDATGNLYIWGTYEGMVDFDPGPATYNLNSAGLQDIYIAKYDLNGTFIWAKSIGGQYDESIGGLVCDPAGNIILSGSFKWICDFNPGAPINNLISQGESDIYICKLTDAGNFMWVRQIGGEGTQDCEDIKGDNNGNFILTGTITDTVDFDPGPGTYSMNSNEYGEIFVCKLNSVGNFVWARQMGGTEMDNGYEINIDPSGAIYSTGFFSGTADFDPGPGVFNLVSGGSSDIYISKLNSLGNFVWAKRIGGSNGDFGRNIVTDAIGNVFVSGTFADATDFDPGPGVFNLSHAGGWDAFLMKLDFAGNFVWAKQFGGNDYDYATNLLIAPDNSLFLTGAFLSINADFDPGAATHLMTPVGSYDAFISKLDENGDFVWAEQIGGSVDDIISGVVIDAANNLYLHGMFMNIADFDPGVGVYNMTANGYRDGFLLKINQGAPLPVQLSGFTAVAELSSNILNWTTENEKNNSYFNIERSADGIHFNSIGHKDGGGTSEIRSHYTFIDDTPLQVSYYRLKQTDFDGNEIFSQIIKLTRKITNYDLTLWPNPANSQLNLAYNVNTKSYINTGIYNLTGMMLHNASFELEDGAGNKNIDISTLPPGIYLLKWNDRKTEQVLMFSKQ